MDLRLIEIFCHVYEKKSFSIAAQQLQLSQPTVSGHVKTLEQYFGVPLFNRLGARIEATAPGELLYQYGRRIVELKRNIIDVMNRSLNRFEGRLSIGASTIPGEYLIPKRLGKLCQDYPKVQFSILIQDSQKTIERIRDGSIELGFVGAKTEAPGLEFQEFASDELIFVTPPAPPWEQALSGLSLEELKKKPLVVREEGSGTRLILARRLQELGTGLEDFSVVAELGSAAAVKEAIRSHVGGSFVSSLCVQTELDAGWVRRIDVHELGPLTRHFYTVINTHRWRSPICDLFLESLSASTICRQ